MAQQNHQSSTTNTIPEHAAAFTETPSPENKMIIHHVFFWLRNPDSKEDLNLLLEGVNTLRKINTVRELYIGVPASTETRDVIESSYHVSELLFFENLEGQKAYQDDPIHLAFVQRYSHLWKKVVVYDVQQVI